MTTDSDGVLRIEAPSGEALAKRIVYLAWKAVGGPFGMGAFQDRGPNVPEDEVWKAAYHKTDYPGGRKFTRDEHEVDCDYVLGRMMKFRFRFGPDWVEARERELRMDYEAWCHKYPTVRSLLNAAVASFC